MNDVDEFKDFIKECITRFIAEPVERTAKENKTQNGRPVNRAIKPAKKKNIKGKRDVSSDEYSSESSVADDDVPTSPSALRSLAKAVGVPPSFWSGLDKTDATMIGERLASFCDSKNIPRKDRLPSIQEAKKYKAQREAAAELEGINATNIVSSKRKRSQDFMPLFL